MPTAEVQDKNTLGKNVYAVFQERKKWWLAAIVVVGRVGDAIKDHFSDKAVDFLISKLGPFGDFLTGNPFAITSIGVVIALVVLTAMVISESSKEVPSFIYEHRDKPFMKPRARRPWLAGFIMVMALLIFTVVFGTYGYWSHVRHESAAKGQPTATAPTLRPPVTQKPIETSSPSNTKKVGHRQAALQKLTSPISAPIQSPPPQVSTQQIAPQNSGNNSLTQGDRERLSNLVYKFSQMLNTMTDLGVKTDNEITLVGNEVNDGSIVKSYEAHLTTLRDIGSTSTQLGRKFASTRGEGDWAYYSVQTNYVFGDNPDNLGPNAITNTAQSLVYSVEQWSSIKDRENKSALHLLSEGVLDARRSLSTFYEWKSGCQSRLERLKASLK